MRPGIAWLVVQHPIHVSYVIGRQNSVLALELIGLRERVANERRINSAVYHDVRDVDTLRSEFASHALCKPAQGMLCT